MRKLLYLILCLSAFTASAVDVVWNFADFVANSHATRRVVITPISPWGTNASSIITGDRRTYTNTVNGQLQVSNIVAGYSYRVEFYGPFAVTAITNSFASDLTGYVDGKDYIGIPLLNSGVVAYSQAASDSRYIRTNLIKSHLIAGSNVTFATNAAGSITISSTGGASGSATNVFFLDSSTITWSTTSSSNVAKLSSNVTNDWRNYTLAASNSITAAVTNQNTGTSNGLFAHIVAATNSLGGSGVDAPTVVAIMSTNNAATATTATTATAATFAARAPAQMPSSLFSAWNSGTLLLSLSGSGNEVSHLSEASIGSIGTKYGLFYSSYDSGTTGRISAAYGSLLNGFVKHGVVLAPTAASWDSGLIGGVTHFRENGTNYLYYFGGTNFGAFEAEPLHAGVAYSTDGTNYTKYASNPIMTVEQVGGSCITVYTWFTKRIATGYLGFFNAKHSSGVTERIHLASATNPLGPWTYVGEIYHHTNATVTSDFTVADLSEGGYIGAYWIITNGFARSSFAFSDNLTNWVPAGNGPASAFVGGRFFYDDGLAYSYCLSQTAVYYTRPKKSNQGAIEATTVSATSFSGDGSAVSGVTAQYLGSFGAGLNGSDYYLYADVVGGLNDPNLWIYNDSTLRWRSPGGIISGGGFIGSAAGLTNAASGLFSGIVISTNTGSLLNAVGFTNGNVTIPGTLSVSGTTTAGTLYSPSISGDGLGITNAVDLIAGDSSITIVTNANKRSFTLTSTGSGGGGWTGNPKQFSVVNGQTNILDGGYVSNLVNWIDGFNSNRTLIVDKDDDGLTYLSYDLDNSTLLFGRPPIADGRWITNINAANISGDLSVNTITTVTQVVTGTIIGNGSGLTNLNNSNDEETRSWQNITYYGTGQSKNTMETYGPAPFYNNDGMTQSAANQIARWSWPAPVNAVSCVVRYQVFSAYVGTVAWTNYPQVTYNAPSGRVSKDAANDSRLTNSVIACPSGTFTWHTNYIYWDKTNTSIFPGVVWNASTNASARYVVGPVFIKWGY